MERKQVLVDVGTDLVLGNINKGACSCCHKQGEASLLPHCIICGEVPEGGIMDGIFGQGQFLCTGCEQDIVALDGDAVSREEYLAMAEKLKKIIS